MGKSGKRGHHAMKTWAIERQREPGVPIPDSIGKRRWHLWLVAWMMSKTNPDGHRYRLMTVKALAMCALPLLAGCSGLLGNSAPAPSPLSAQVDAILANYALLRKLELGMLAIDQSPVVMSVPSPVVVTPNPPGAPPVVVTPVPAPTLPGPVVSPSLRPLKRHRATIDQMTATAMLNAEQLP